jgi:RNA polymerase sigma-70 factor (sigma-E family)
VDDAPPRLPSDTEFREFVRGRSMALLRAAYLLTGDQHHAEDLVQEALARTHRAWGRLRDSGNAEAYARRVMYHHQVSFWRRRRVAEVLPGELPERADPNGDGYAESSALRLSLHRALLSLPPRQRAIVVLRYFEDHTETETADLLGVRVGTVKAQCHRALQRLREQAPELNTLYLARGAAR